MSLPDLNSPLFEAAADGALLLTANKRLARSLRDGYDQWMLAQGKQVWNSARILSYDGWLGAMLTELGDSWRLLGPSQELCLWEELIGAQEEPADGLLQLTQTAQKALEAHHLLKEYAIELPADGLSEDQQMFARWQRACQQHCRRQGWLERSDLPRWIGQALEQQRLQSPAQLLLCGFDQPTPGLLMLQQALRSAGCNCTEAPQALAQGATVSVVAATERRAEIDMAGRWARRKLAQGSRRIGIVVVDLQRNWRQVERLLREQIDPQACFSGQPAEGLINLSVGGSLADQGIVHAALQWLSVGRVLRQDQLSALLRSPYVAAARAEADARAAFDLGIRSLQRENHHLSTLLERLQGEPSLAGLARLFSCAQQQQKKGKQSAADWARDFAETLHQFGWPGEKGLSSHEYQALSAWQSNALEALARLDQVLPIIDRKRALALLQRLSRERSFQPEGSQAAVQVVGLLESTGLQFDHLWVIGLNDHLFPARPAPNPFIPGWLQQQHDLPHSGVEREYRFARQMIDRLSGSAAEVVFSYAALDGDTELRPSPLLSRWPLTASEQLPLAEPNDPRTLQLEQAIPLESCQDDRGLPLPALQSQGGIGLLRDQAECPFRAYLHHRLAARALAEPGLGLAASERGDLVHLALEGIWRELGSSERLHALDEAQLEQLVSTQVAAAVTKKFPGAGLSALLELEQQRLQRLLLDWLLQVELKRPSFQVLATEQQLCARLESLEINIKLDRIDQTEDGRVQIIDYKTGQLAALSDFFNEPLVEPQLPLYAVSHQGAAISAVLFAQVRLGAFRLSGLSDGESDSRSIKSLQQLDSAAALGITDWAQLTTHWQTQLDRLARDFACGEAQVQPFDPDRACRYCDLKGLCRFHAGAAGGGYA